MDATCRGLGAKGPVINYGEGGGYKTIGRGGRVKFYPQEKRGGKSLSHAEGETHKVFG